MKREVSLFIKINLNEEPWPDFPDEGSFMSCVETDRELNQFRKEYQNICFLEKRDSEYRNSGRIFVILSQRSNGEITK